MRRAMFVSMWRRLAGIFIRSQTPSEPPIAPENVTQATAPSVPQDTLACTDRNGHDLQRGDLVAVVGETSKDNCWYISQIEGRGKFRNVTVMRWHSYLIDYHPDLLYVDVNGNIARSDSRRWDVLSNTGYMQSSIRSNNNLVFLERPINERDDPLRREWSLLSSHVNLVLHVQGTNKKFVFDADQLEELTIGRKDSDTGETPDVDLSDAGALEKGISRRHAILIRKDGSLQIMDNGAPNGTYLNGQKLLLRQTRVIHDGDDIRLGCLVMHIEFQRKTPLLFTIDDRIADREP